MHFLDKQQQARDRSRLFLVQFALVSALCLISVFLATMVIIAPLLNAIFFNLFEHYGWQPDVLARIEKMSWAEKAWLNALTAVVYSLILSLAVVWRRTWLLRQSDDYVARLLGAWRILDVMDEPELQRVRNVTAEMALAAGIAPPRLRLWTTDNAINIVTLGRGPSDSTIFVSRLALRALSREELQALMAYGVSQILNGDTALITRTAAYRNALRWPADLAWGLLTAPAHADGDLVETVFFWLLFGLWFGLLLGAVTLPQYYAAQWLQKRISNERQRLADASMLQFTRHPLSVIGALVKASSLSAASIPLKPFVRDLSQASFVPLPGFPTSEHLPVVTRIQAISPSMTEHEICAMQREAIRVFEREEKRRAELAREAKKAQDLDPFPGATAVDRLAGLVALEQAVVMQEAASREHQALRAQRNEAAQAARELEEATERARDNPPDPRMFAALQRLNAAVASFEPAPNQDPRGVVLGLLVDRRQEVKQRQLEFLRSRLPEPEHAGLIRAIHSHRGLPHDQRVAVLQNWLSRLRELPAAALRELRVLIRDLEELDDHTDVFEYGLARMAEVFLADVLTTRGPHGDRTLTQCADAAQGTLSVIAQFTAKQKAREAFQAGVKRLGLGRTLKYSPELHWIPYLDRALTQLDALMPHEKRLLLDAGQAIVAFDAGISGEESELMRVIAASLHCPTLRVANPNEHQDT